MPDTMTETEFRAWEARQPLRFARVDGRPVRLPDGEQGPSRVARVRQVAARVLADKHSADAWMAEPHGELGDLEPETLAAESEDGCQTAMRLLVGLGRSRAKSGG